jgi:RNAse (barnase) inhibitor barstar
MNIDYRIKNLENLWNNLNNQTKQPLIIYIYKDLNIIEVEKNKISIQQYIQIKPKLIENYSIIEVEIIDNSYLENTFWENK